MFTPRSSVNSCSHVSSGSILYNTYCMRTLVLIALLFTIQDLYARDNEFQFIIENDSVMQTDMYYTSGVKLFYQRDLIENVDSIIRLRLGYVQEIYTPKDLKSTEAVDDDYPYTGLHYALLGFSYSSHSTYFRADVWRGVQGPRAEMGKIQQFIHRVTGSEIPNGWGNQTEAQDFWNGDFMLLKRFTSSVFEFSPWVKYKVGDLRSEVEPGLRLGMRAGFAESFADFSMVYVDYDAVLQGPKSASCVYIIDQDDMNRRYFKADIGVAFHFTRFGTFAKATWVGPQFKTAKTHSYMSLGLSFYW